MSIQKRGEGKDLRHIVRWRDESGEHSKSFTKARDAKAFDAERRAAALRGEAIGVKGVGSKGQLPMKHWVNQWYESTLVPGTKSARSTLVANLGGLSDIPIHKLDRPAVQAWVNELATGRSWKNGTPLQPATVKVCLVNLRSIIRLAIEDEVITRDVTSKVTVPTSSIAIEPKAIPSALEVRRMIDASAVHGPSFTAMVRLAAATGMRVSEVCGLTTSDVDVQNQIISVTGQLDRRGSRVGTKTVKSRRDIPVGQEVIDLLEPFLFRSSVNEPIFTKDGEATLKPGPWTNRAAGEALRKLRREGAIGGFTFHSLRHYYASTLLSKGVNVKALQETMGHASAQTTLDIYAHVLPRSLDGIRKASNDILRDF